MTKAVLNASIAILIAALFYSMNITAATSDTSDLATLLSGFNSMTANFSQVIYDSSGNAMQKNTGKMALQRPGKFRWDVENNSKQLLVADGQYLWIYDKDLEQATKQKLDKNQANSPAWLLSGSVQSMKDRFLVYRVKKGEPGEWYQLKPYGKKDLFKWIQLHFVDGKLMGMELFDNLGQLSTFSFTDVKTGSKLPESLFQFHPPKGVEVIQN